MNPTMEKVMEELKDRPIPYTVWPQFRPDKPYGTVQAITFDGLNIGDKKTRVFAYLAFPERADEHTPGIVLIHGGGGHSFLPWMKLWLDRGYAVIAPDTTGDFPCARNAGAQESHEGWVFELKEPFAEEGYVFAPHNDGMYCSEQPIHTQWMYHALAQTMMCFNILAQSGKTDPARIGVTGISWGGVITALYLGYDDRPAFAIPIYGSAYLGEALSWMKDDFAGEKTRELWLAEDRLDRVGYPVLWLCWNDDNCFSYNSNSKSYLDTMHTPGTRLAGIHYMQHSHTCGWVRPESYVFADSVVYGTTPLPGFVTLPDAFSPCCTAEGAARARLVYLTEEMTYSQHKKYGYESTFLDPEWQFADLTLENGRVSGTYPPEALYAYVEIATDGEDIADGSGKGRVCVTSPLLRIGKD